jgi:hypothetical protein
VGIDAAVDLKSPIAVARLPDALAHQCPCIIIHFDQKQKERKREKMRQREREDPGYKVKKM